VVVDLSVVAGSARASLDFGVLLQFAALSSIRPGQVRERVGLGLDWETGLDWKTGTGRQTDWKTGDGTGRRD
jgi:hypothetical protein